MIESKIPMKSIVIHELGRRDASQKTEHLKKLKELIAANDDKYPGIDRWFDTKVITGLSSGERMAFLAFDGERAVASAILKKSRSAKFCHLRIDDSYQNEYLGQVFFIRMTLAVLDYAKSVHFTLPESLWDTKGEFFKSFGFTKTVKTLRHYRSNDDELSCSASLATVWSAILQKLPTLLEKLYSPPHHANSNLVISLKSRFAERIVSGEKTIEIRKKFHSKWAGHDAFLYASQPVGGFVGKASITNVTHGHPTDIWTQFEGRIGCSKKDFEEYVESAAEVSAIEFDNVVRFENSIPLRLISDLLRQKLTAPQSYAESSLIKNTGLTTAVYLTELLQGRF